MEVVAVRKDRALSASSWLILDLATSFARSFSVHGPVSPHAVRHSKARGSIPANASPLSSAACDVSTRVTGTLAFLAATNAIPRPYLLIRKTAPCTGASGARKNSYHLARPHDTQGVDLGRISSRGSTEATQLRGEPTGLYTENRVRQHDEEGELKMW